MQVEKELRKDSGSPISEHEVDYGLTKPVAECGAVHSRQGIDTVIEETAKVAFSSPEGDSGSDVTIEM